MLKSDWELTPLLSAVTSLSTLLASQDGTELNYCRQETKKALKLRQTYEVWLEQ